MTDDDMTRDRTNESPSGSTPAVARHTTPDIVTLVAGVLALVASGYVLVGGPGDLRVQWLLAAAAVVVGIIMLIASVRSRRDR